MLGINSNINSLVAQQNLSGSQSALSQAITRLSSGKRINSAADDAAGLAISTGMQTQINGLNQGVSNANDGVSMIQTATSGLAQITSSLQRIRTLAVQASSGGLTADNQASLQQEVAQQIAEVNRIASQTTYNGKSVLDGSAGNVSFQVGANVGQTINLNLSQGVSSALLGKGVVASGNTLGTLQNLSLNSDGSAHTGTSAAAITSINVLSDGNGGFTYTDQNNQALSSKATSALFGNSTGAGGALNLTLSSTSALSVSNQLSTISAANATPPSSAGTTLGTITGISIDASTGKDVPQGTANAITSITVKSDGAGGYQFADQSGNALAAGLVGDDSGSNPGTLFTSIKGATGQGDKLEFTSETSQLDSINAANNSGGGAIAAGKTLGVVSGLSLDATGNTVASSSATITKITVKSDGAGGFKLFNQSGAAISDATAAVLTGVTSNAAGSGNTASHGNLFTVTADANGTGNAGISLTSPNTELSDINTAYAGGAATDTNSYTINNVSIDAVTGQTVAAGTQGAITSITVKEDGAGGFSFTDQNGNALAKSLTGVDPNAVGSANNDAAGSLFTIAKDGNGTGIAKLNFTGGSTAVTLSPAGPDATPKLAAIASIDSNNNPGTVANIDISTTDGANQAMESIDNALKTVNNIQATLGAAQNRFTAIATTQQAQSTDLAQAQSNITDANFAQETANLSKAQVLQQAGISVLAQANSLPQQVLKLLQ
ncbi:flagellin [Paraburkholderia strydomiana]|nr:flagellin [Paraburkholderia strydomiana]